MPFLHPAGIVSCAGWAEAGGVGGAWQAHITVIQLWSWEREIVGDPGFWNEQCMDLSLSDTGDSAKAQPSSVRTRHFEWHV